MLSFRRSFHRIRKNDVVFLRNITRPDKTHLSKPLQPGSETGTANGPIMHDDIIGQEPRSIVESRGGTKFIMTKATTEDYVMNRRRDAQPIYPLDAQMIVALADLNLDYPTLKPIDGEEIAADEAVNVTVQKKRINVAGLMAGGKYELQDEPQHFLECGTGHGSLTLAIASKIHSANCYFDGENEKLRGAVLHSLDRNAIHLKTGTKNLAEFHGGMYMNDVKFHLSEGPTEWLSQNDVKLSGCFLDLPAPEEHIAAIAKKLVVDAPLLIFTPSITQIWEVADTIRRSHSDPSTAIKLSFGRAMELLPGGGGLREWDLRSTTIRETGKTGIVCRPKVGVKVVGGGFIGEFRKLPEFAELRSKERKPQAEPESKSQAESQAAV